VNVLFVLANDGAMIWEQVDVETQITKLMVEFVKESLMVLLDLLCWLDIME
jgi:hypothetical protein